MDVLFDGQPRSSVKVLPNCGDANASQWEWTGYFRWNADDGRSLPQRKEIHRWALRVRGDRASALEWLDMPGYWDGELIVPMSEVYHSHFADE